MSNMMSTLNTGWHMDLFNLLNLLNGNDGQDESTAIHQQTPGHGVLHDRPTGYRTVRKSHVCNLNVVFQTGGRSVLAGSGTGYHASASRVFVRVLRGGASYRHRLCFHPVSAGCFCLRFCAACLHLTRQKLV